MSATVVGGQVRIHVRGRDHLAEVVATSRSRATVRYTDSYGEQRVVTLSLAAVSAA